ncbi:MAG: polysaccharide biosynthesis tyrosine autokinase [Phycisphaerae bacterium]
MSTLAHTQPMMPAPAPVMPTIAVAAPASGAGDAGFGFADAMRVLKQRKVTVIVTTLVVYVLVVAATFLTFRFAPLWMSEAVLELEPPPQDVYGLNQQLVQPEMMRQQLETEARKLRQLSLLLEVASLPEIKDTDFYKYYGDAGKCAVELQLKHLSAAPIPETQLIRVALACKNKRDAKLIVDRIVDKYYAKYSEESMEAMRVRYQQLNESLTKHLQDLDSKRRELAAFREQRDVPALESDRTVNSSSITNLTEQMSLLEAEAANYDAQLAGLRGIDPSKLPITAEMQLLIENDPVLRFYRSQVETIEVEIQTAKSLLGENHRQVKTMETRREGYMEKETAKREELINQFRDQQLEDLRQKLANARSVQARLADQLEQAEARQRDLNRNISRYQEMVKDEESLARAAEKLQEQVMAADHMRTDRSRVRLSVVQRPQEAVKPSRPDFPTYLGGGAVLALLAGVGLAFLREFTDKAVRTPIDVARHGQFSVLGSVPLLDDEEADVDHIEHASSRQPQSLVAEAFRQVRTNLLFSGPAESQRALLITSPGPGDGKTTIAINLAVTLAQSGQRVLLIDCNFRRPMIRENFPEAAADGLSNTLTGQAPWEQLATRSSISGLDILSSGPMPPNPSELLGSVYMRDLIDQAKRKYDRVILDGPPSLLVTDALILAVLVDGVVMVSRAVANSRGALRRAREQLERINARIIGAVLNGVQARAGGYFRRQYRDYYDYTAENGAALPGGNGEAPPEK